VLLQKLVQILRTGRFFDRMFSPGLSCSLHRFSGLFLMPWSLLFFALLAFNRAKVAAPLSIWRRYLLYVAMLAASVSTYQCRRTGLKWRTEARARSWRRDSELEQSRRTIFMFVATLKQMPLTSPRTRGNVSRLERGAATLARLKLNQARTRATMALGNKTAETM